MTRIAIAGAAGRMGQTIVRELQTNQVFTLTAALEHKNSEALGKDVGFVSGIEAKNIFIQDSLNDASFDVLIDFTRPEPTMEHVALCLENKASMVVGTTGLDDQQKDTIIKAGKHIPILLAANTSVAVNLCASLVEMASKVLGDVVDIEIIEAHHRHKVDAPSGTALLLGESVAKALNKDLSKDGVFERYGHTGERIAGSIGFSTIRGGDIAGEHTVMFIGENERIEITHRATNRKIFAQGAIRAATWLCDQQSGFYTMKDALGLV
ncbi:MAG: 4-hydroxy-tetrahydrodipicolinate reductase [Gammaproteobacteria bacterium]|nr:4-hydroxy-tetrahydrodipicolinate reductase [Gammaproteobacteria bacterium]